MFYTGIGCREHGVSEAHRKGLEGIGEALCAFGMTLRSGHATGCDMAFERGAAKVSPQKAEIYLPWSGFRKPDNLKGVQYLLLSDRATKWARKQLISSEVLCHFDRMGEPEQAFHARNVFQVVGKQRENSQFVVFFAPLDEFGKVLGGTRTAVNLATSLDIPTFNLKTEEGVGGFFAYIQKQGDPVLTASIDTSLVNFRGGVK